MNSRNRGIDTQAGLGVAGLGVGLGVAGLGVGLGVAGLGVGLDVRLDARGRCHFGAECLFRVSTMSVFLGVGVF